MHGYVDPSYVWLFVKRDSDDEKSFLKSNKLSLLC